MPGRSPAATPPSHAELAGVILEWACLCAFRRLAGVDGRGCPGGFDAALRAEADGMLRDLEDADPAVAAAVSALIDSSGW